MVLTWERLVHPDDKQKAWDAAQARLRGETEQFENEERLRHKDGRWLWTLHRGKVIERDDSGRPLRKVGTHSDITARKNAAEALQASLDEKERVVADSAPRMPGLRISSPRIRCAQPWFKADHGKKTPRAGWGRG